MMRIEPLTEKAGAITSTVVLVMLLLSPPATAVNVVIDYSYDTNNFFGSGNPDGTAAGAQAKASLEEAANFLSDLMQDSFSPINTPPTFSSQVFDGEIYFEFTASFTHPGDGSTVTLNNEPFAADEYRIYAGGRSLSGNTLGIGGVGGQGLSVTNNGGSFTQDEFNQVTAITDLFVSQVNDRGETPGDFTRWGGSITFDNDSSPNWHYDHTTLPSTGENDFFSVALHELTHALGFGVSSEWNDLVSAGFFTGPTSTAVYGGSVPVTGGHV
ncbi:MAG: hypothetical protein MI741_17330, partial [Rhodospirillales bacterium]|nr:hypothetical protein [Rhodospirillales bacterium]